ncbi:hypothetical protein PSYMO_05640 [Pseudomonas amygdali pv. mori str. 301020]|uniref:Uncharacterized protein n=1 Tax=Pseudomonas amygdali pv. mori str. 301020 TaxID=629261 RepID=A0A656G606_PSEA0|nr:hypothetical protein PSYMO_05640 [Pseudomonas amygdali pv. mori str. 301020]
MVTRAWHLANAVKEPHMHQTISQRRAILEGLRQRCTLSTAEFYDKVGRNNPAALPRFTVVPNGNNEFGIVERSTGDVRGVLRGHSAACRAAEQMEAQPVRQPSIATHMLRWTAAIATGFVLFALYGAS